MGVSAGAAGFPFGGVVCGYVSQMVLHWDAVLRISQKVSDLQLGGRMNGVVSGPMREEGMGEVGYTGDGVEVLEVGEERADSGVDCCGRG
jgi:hypothetical protein